ncbi:leucyl aminopeptidase family protein [Sphingobacterium faecale]|uniref:Leucyl aminopeptidase n=1 Tax=Sphingobacterium faecale TaxID=2803775 RepID=A0ABS1QY54_9SPHI|nr:leucyl aminopeptidase [Sphingobacterium faecale]MBL1407234.1 leucyl aminopeptidase [Sphingobacterium faecale]
MSNNYLHLDLVGHAGTETAPPEMDSLIVLTERTQVQRLGIPAVMLERIEKAFSGDKTVTFNVFGSRHTLLILVPDKGLETLRLAGASAYGLLRKHGVQALRIKGLHVLEKKERYAILEGMILNSYSFDKYKTEKDTDTVVAHLPARLFSQADLQELKILTEAISLTKTLVNEPPNSMNAVQFADVVQTIGRQYGFDTEILEKSEIEELGMGGLLAVNRGSVIPPTLSVMRYRPADALNKKPIVLVGKGVMFDTGGYSVKVGGNMISMKSDMAGGAAVLGLIAAIAGNELPYYVVGLVPATDNKIAAEALVVDDIIRMMDGTTVEVQNTDAEGRLILADALTYAKRFDPELVIDMATLTGASAAITGPYGIAVLGNDQQQIDVLKDIGEQVYERLLQLPLWKEFRELLKSGVADRSNLGGPVGGVSTSAIFLEHFTDYPWIHLDIAGAAFVKEAKGYRQKGATAVPVRLLYEFVKSRIKRR